MTSYFHYRWIVDMELSAPSFATHAHPASPLLILLQNFRSQTSYGSLVVASVRCETPVAACSHSPLDYVQVLDTWLIFVDYLLIPTCFKLCVCVTIFLGHTATAEKVHWVDLKTCNTHSTRHLIYYRCQLLLLPCTFLCSFLSDFDNNDRTARNISHSMSLVAFLVSPPAAEREDL